MAQRSLRVTGNILFALFILLTTACPWISATDIRGEFSFLVTVGKIETDGETVIAITGKVLDLPVRILLNGDTLVQYASGLPLEPDAIPGGSTIQVKAEWTSEGFVAKAISLNDAAQVMVIGLVEDTSLDRIVVANLEIRLGDQTSVDAVPELGQLVIVQCRYLDGGILMATSVESQSHLKLFGKIEDINAADQSLLVSSKTVYVTDKTVIKGADKTKLTFRDLEVGQFVEVEGDLANGKFVAKTLVVADPKKVIIDGTVTAYDKEKSISVKVALETVSIAIYGKTEIRGTPAVGATVHIEAALQKDGSLLALRITVKSSNDDKTKVAAVHGTIEQIGSSSFAVAGVTVKVDDQTEIKSKGQTISFSNLKVGDKVVVLGTRQSDGSILARKIEVMPKVEPPAHVEGTIQTIGSSSFAVAGVTVKVDDQTEIKSKGQTISFSNLKVGDKVVVLGTKQSDGSILARKIEVMPKVEPPATIQGTIQTIGSSSFTVAGVTVKVDDQTEIKSEGQTIRFADLKVGNKVVVHGTKQSDGSILARKIEVMPKVEPPATIQGTIQTIGSSSFTVARVTVKVDDQTEIKSKGQTIRFADLKVGDKVVVQGTKQSDGSILAQKIEVMPKVEPPAHVEGTIQSLGTSSFVVGGVKVVVNDKTVIKYKGSTMKFADLKIGFRVNVEGTKQSDGSILALKIEVAGK